MHLGERGNRPLDVNTINVLGHSFTYEKNNYLPISPEIAKICSSKFLRFMVNECSKTGSIKELLSKMVYITYQIEKDDADVEYILNCMGAVKVLSSIVKEKYGVPEYCFME